MKVMETNFNDLDERSRSPIVVYSSFSVRPNGTVVKLINIENVRGNDTLNLEIFSTNNFYLNGSISSNTGDLGIFTFRCHDSSAKYFIKITVELDKSDNNSYQENVMIYGFYKFEESFDDNSEYNDDDEDSDIKDTVPKNITMKIDNKNNFSFLDNINEDDRILNIDILSNNEKSDTEEEDDETTSQDN